MTAKEYYNNQDRFEYFTKLTNTGISDDFDEIMAFAEAYHEHKLKLLGIADVVGRSEQLVCPDCADGRDEFESDWKCPDCRQKDDANNMLEAELSLIQAKDAAMREGKKIKHCSFMDDEYLYYKNGYWFTHHDCQLPDVCFLNEQEQGWWSDGWSVVS